MEHALARRLFTRPPRWLVRLVGRGDVTVDGAPLDDAVRVMMWLHDKRTKPLSAMPPALSRKQMRRDARVHQGVLDPVAATRDLLIDGAAGPLRARHYANDGPLFLYFHGGGFVIGDLDTHDAFCRLLCHHAGVAVLSVEYRKSPEVVFPAAVDDAWAAYQWTLAHKNELGAGRLIIGGDSAGGNLAAVTTIRARDEKRELPVLQVLIYPAVDRVTARPSMDQFGVGYLLRKADVEWYFDTYAPAGDRQDLRISPLFADLRGLPPALIVTAAFDTVRDEGEAYAEALKQAGNEVTQYRALGLVHGFVNFTGLIPAARKAAIELAERVRQKI